MAWDLEPENFKSVALHTLTSLILLPLAVVEWSSFYSFEGLMGLCNTKIQSEERAMVLTSVR